MKFTILHTEASSGWGGQEIRTFNESLGMRDRGHNVLISANPGSRLLEYAAQEGIKTIPRVFKRRNAINMILFFKKLIEKEKIDIVNTHSSKDSWLVLPAARIAANKPIALRTRHLSTGIHKGFQNRFLYETLPHAVITTGESIRKQMIDINRFNAHKIVSIPTGVDTDSFNPDRAHHDIREELKLDRSTPLAGSVSVIRSWKGLEYLISALPLILKVIPDAKFIIAGEGPYISGKIL
jgi:glycosyltransferase involved in cell wall biosynthesis